MDRRRQHVNPALTMRRYAQSASLDLAEARQH
jgi:hypothetical protein